MERIRFGEPAAPALRTEVDRVGAKRVFLMVSGSLNRNTDEIAKVVEALGDRYAGLNDHMPPFAPQDAIAVAAAQARALEADLIVTFGGGSLTDAGKIIQLCLRHDITDPAALEPFRMVTNPDGTRHLPVYAGPVIRQFSIPTTLSAGEMNSQGGSLDPGTMKKRSFRHPLFVPRVVIYDPQPTVHTPEWIWLSTGVRVIDHAVELICASEANPYSDGNALHALRLISRALPRVKQDPGDMAARLDCQLAASLSLIGRAGDVPLGISHAIGHSLGAACAVPHGVTSCLILPHTMRYNRPVVGHRYPLIAEALGRPGEDPADVIEELIGALGMPQRLSAVKVGRDQFRHIAEHAMYDPWLHANPRKIRGPDQVVEILEMFA